MCWDVKGLVTNNAPISWEVPHSVEQAQNRDIPQFVAEQIIRRLDHVSPTYPNPQTDAPRWLISGIDDDERPINIVIEIKNDKIIIVITVIRKDE